MGCGCLLPLAVFSEGVKLLLQCSHITYARVSGQGTEPGSHWQLQMDARVSVMLHMQQGNAVAVMWSDGNRHQHAKRGVNLSPPYMPCKRYCGINIGEGRSRRKASCEYF